jgi:hypothetical protein
MAGRKTLKSQAFVLLRGLGGSGSYACIVKLCRYGPGDRRRGEMTRLWCVFGNARRIGSTEFPISKNQLKKSAQNQPFSTDNTQSLTCTLTYRDPATQIIAPLRRYPPGLRNGEVRPPMEGSALNAVRIFSYYPRLLCLQPLLDALGRLEPGVRRA